MRGTKAPLIFDDPVTSLDYRRLDEVAARIQNAETHQVVVLTHNIMFASALMAARQNKNRTKIYEVRATVERPRGTYSGRRAEARYAGPTKPSDQRQTSRDDQRGACGPGMHSSKRPTTLIWRLVRSIC